MQECSAHLLRERPGWEKQATEPPWSPAGAELPEPDPVDEPVEPAASLRVGRPGQKERGLPKSLRAEPSGLRARPPKRRRQGAAKALPGPQTSGKAAAY